VYAAQPGAAGWQFADVTDAVREATTLCELVGDYEGAATIAGYTVLYQGDKPWRAVAICDLPNGARTVVYSEDSVVVEGLLSGEFVGRSVAVIEGQFS